MTRESGEPAVCLLSGGLDSATTLAIARHRGFVCHALSFDYGQRHRFELDSARKVASALGAADHRIVRLDLSASGGFGHSALTDAIAVPKDRVATGPAEQPSGHQARGADRRPGPPPPPSALANGQLQMGDWQSGIPVTYVPGRNTIFLSIALAYAEVVGAFDIFLGVNAIDYSGYPDCRPEFIEAFERLANLATAAAVEGRKRFRIHAPLIRMTKGEIIRTGLSLGVDYSLTHSCYDPSPDGAACGHCDSCRLRLAGFKAAGATDPAKYR